MNQRNRLKLHLLITVLIMLFIFWQSSLPAGASSQESRFIVSRLPGWLQADEDLLTVIVRKGAHFLEYLVLGVSMFLTVRDLSERRQTRSRNLFWIPWLLSAVYAVSDELHQYFVPGRSCQARDMILDALGAAAGVAACCIVRKRLRYRKE